MRKFKIIQKQMDAFCNVVLDENVIEQVPTYDRAVDFLHKREYKFDEVRQQWIRGNAFQFPIVIEKPIEVGIFDIRSFV